MEPHAIASRVGRFAFTAVAIVFLAVSTRIFRHVVQRNTGLGEPQALPERPRRIAQWLCHVSTASLFLGTGFLLAHRLHAIWLLLLSLLFYAVAARYLGQTVWGLPNAFRRERGRFDEVLRRLVEVIRHGRP